MKIELIEKLAEKLGTTAEYLWSVLVHQAPVSAIISSVALVLSIIVFPILTKYMKWVNDNYSSLCREGKEGFHIFGAIGSGIVVVAIIIMGPYCVEDAIQGFLYPEFWALDYIMSKISQ